MSLVLTSPLVAALWREGGREREGERKAAQRGAEESVNVSEVSSCKGGTSI